MTEIWEPHPVYPHQGSSLGRIRTREGRIISQRPSNRPDDKPPGQRYRLADLCLPGGKKKTVSVHKFITECHWGMRPSARHQARHDRGGPADNRWVNLLGWGTQEDNEADKDPEVRRAAARIAHAARFGYAVQPEPVPTVRWRDRLAATFRNRHRDATHQPTYQKTAAHDRYIDQKIESGAPVLAVRGGFDRSERVCESCGRAA